MNNKIYITWGEIYKRLKEVKQHHGSNSIISVYGVPKGGMILAGFLVGKYSEYFKMCDNPNECDLILDDLFDSGGTYEKYKNYLKPFIFLFNKQEEKRLKNKWIIFPWERDHPNGEENVQQNIIRQLQYIGEDTNREGLKETPNRILKSYTELYAGYDKDPKELFTVFESEGYDQIILLKDFEMYSMCEHHMLPFFGKCHVAYIPDKKVIGISKLARLVEIYSRRLQIQERIGKQVTMDLMEYLQPLGAACIIEAKHMCMCMRGVNKQNSIMTTSSMRGVFMDDRSAKEELMNLIR